MTGETKLLCNSCGQPLDKPIPRVGRRPYRCDTCKKLNRQRRDRKQHKLYRNRYPERVKASKDAYKQANLPAVRKYMREYWQNRKAVPVPYATLFKRQRGVCAICGNPETKTNKYGTVFSLSYDHDHENGKYRGLLCYNCNLLLGKAKDNLEILTKATRYIRKWRKYHLLHGDLISKDSGLNTG